MKTTESYRPEIDGLRAIAVMSVVLYHLGVPPFRGGFIGVDVFFVISGFLITRIIITQHRNGNFSVLRFFRNRIRRLYPALIVVIASATPFSVFLLTPEHAAAAVNSSIFALLSTSNVLFWLQAGYFDVDALFKPLLHTWSLGVEWQFYLLWPALVGIALWLRRAWAVPALLALCVVAGLLVSALWLQADHAGAFFLAPARVFEFAIGAGVLLLDRYRLSSGLALETLSICGLALIVISATQFTSAMPFPGVAALVPCLGAALIIFAGHSTTARLLLKNRLSVWLGLISYSLYLVHWPVIVYLGNLAGGKFSNLEKVGLVIGSVTLAWMLYKFVEAPIRQSRSIQIRHWALGGTAALLIAGATAASQAGNQLWTWRYPDAIARAIDPLILRAARVRTWYRLRALNRPYQDDGRAKMFIIGDSQAGDFVNLLAESDLWEKLDVVSAPSESNCQILVNQEYYSANARLKRKCGSYNVLADSRLAEADIVVLAFAWSKEAPKFLPRDIEALLAGGANSVALVSFKKQGVSSVDLIAELETFDGLEREAAARSIVDIRNTNKELASLGADYIYLDLMGSVCPTDDFCHVVDGEKMPLFADKTHFTTYGYRFFASASFLSELRRVLQSRDRERVTSR